MPTGVLNLTLDEASGNLLLEQGRRVYKLPVSGSEWFQNFSEFPVENAVTWSGDFLQDVLDKVAFCISDEDANGNEVEIPFSPDTSEDVLLKYPDFRNEVLATVFERSTFRQQVREVAGKN